MHISHIGEASLLTRRSTQLRLLNVLRVPSVSRSFLSVPKLTRDNNVLAEFHPSHLFVKDWDTRDVLLRGQLRNNDIYALDVPPALLVLSAVSVCLHHIGMRALVILPLPSFDMYFIVRSFQ